MATLALTAAATAIGAKGLAGSLLLAGATAVGSFVDRRLFGPGDTNVEQEGPRLNSLNVVASTEGAPVARVYGRARVGGQIIWATPIEEEVVRSTEEVGGGGKGAPKQTVTTTQYRYYANIAVGLCAGPDVRIARAWADGKELDLREHQTRLYRGGETQQPDPLIEAKEGGAVPAYRGLAYIVLERFALADFGNRIPQLNFEIIRPVVGEIGRLARGVNIIPGATEFGYDPEPVTKTIDATGSGAIASDFLGGIGPTTTSGVNDHAFGEVTDWTESLDQLQGAMPGVESGALVVTWFGSDLRAGECRIEPKVEDRRTTTSRTWRAGGMTRSTARQVSRVATDGTDRPAFGGTPDDLSVVRAIRDMKERGLRVVFYPFVMMDIADGNGLADPYGRTEQPVYPWRGRITCHPAAGQPGSPDKSGAARAQVDAFVGTAQRGHFAWNGSTVTYAGPDEWSFRRMVLHYATLCAAAGGVDAFCIGTEMVGMTTVRDGPTSYPFVDALRALAADVRAILGAGAKLGYAADWSEFHSHRPADGTGDVVFHLDPLWADANTDFIGIDNYFPLSDWRDGDAHADLDASGGGPHDRDYLQSNIEGGEYFDWYYASQDDRDAQRRTPITDGAHGEDWIFRQKDLRGWWENDHRNRPGGVRSATATAWQPRSKPIWFTELGCPAIDKGPNQPNVFVDPKSSESFLPHYSTGARDDVAQRAMLGAVIDYWNDSANNPVSPLYGGAMVDPANVHLWAWDARPMPSFPLDGDAWGDAVNWQFGHWLSGRVGSAYVPDLIEAIAAEHGIDRVDARRAFGAADGYVLDGVMSARAAMEPLAATFGWGLVETDGRMVARSVLDVPPVAEVDERRLVASGENDLVTTTRAQEADLPRSVKMTALSAESDYRPIVAQATRTAVSSNTSADMQVPRVIDQAQAQQAVDRALYAAWAAQESAAFALPPSLLAVEPGDGLRVRDGDEERFVRVDRVTDADGRRIEARGHDRTLAGVTAALRRSSSLDAGSSRIGASIASQQTRTSPGVILLDLPRLRTDDPEAGAYMVAYADPWPDGVALYRSPGESSFGLFATATIPGLIGRTESPLSRGPVGWWDRGNRLRVRMTGQLSSLERLFVLEGGNAFAIRNSAGAWEVIQFRVATLVAPDTYELSELLRGQLGTEGAMQDVPTDAPIVVLDRGVVPLSVSASDVDRDMNFRFGPIADDVTTDRYNGATKAFTGVGMRPFAPVHLRTRASGDDVVLSWTRRTRTGGDEWTAGDVPLGEEAEAYRVEVLDAAGAVVRVIEITATEATYLSAEIVEDFGVRPSELRWRVAQVAGVYGPGSYGTATAAI